ncbi:molecular chaperone [Streptomyces sp. NPDC101160]|uniref:fimbrial biogenesis chaperone n=1 Tax=Streptomyces sp. NPDC101160 TaxID=3366118 RepID=UPI0038016CFE
MTENQPSVDVLPTAVIVSATTVAQVKLYNRTSDAMKIQTRITSEDGAELSADNADVAVSPRTLTLGDRGYRRLKIVSAGPVSDRELRFQLALEQVGGPAEAPSAAAPIPSVWIFYRPVAVEAPSFKAAAEVTVTTEPTRLTFKNPTPYYVNLASVTVDDTNVLAAESDTWIPSLGTRSFEVTVPTGAVITWRAHVVKNPAVGPFTAVAR